MKLKFIKSVNGAEDGINVKRFKCGEAYKVPHDLSFRLADIFIKGKYAEEIEEIEDKEQEENEEIKKKLDLITSKSKDMDDFITIEEFEEWESELEQVPEEEEKANLTEKVEDSVSKFVKNSENKAVKKKKKK